VIDHLKNLPINSQHRLGGFLHRKMAGIVPDPFPHPTIKGKKVVWLHETKFFTFGTILVLDNG